MKDYSKHMSRNDQLSQLKDLLDSGALTQDEFDAAKSRILNSEDEHTPSMQLQTPMHRDADTSPATKKKMQRGIILGCIGTMVAIVIILRSTHDSKAPTYPYDSEELVISDASTVTYGYDYPEEIADELPIGNPWRKDYFHNEWGEDITDSPFIYTVLDGTSWNIHIDYIPPTDEMRWGLFRVYLVDDEGHITDSFGPVNILIRGSDGETNALEITGTRDGITFIEDPSTIEELKYYLNQSMFDIRMEFEKYNERHATQARLESYPGLFLEAIDKLL